MRSFYGLTKGGIEGLSFSCIPFIPGPDLCLTMAKAFDYCMRTVIERLSYASSICLSRVSEGETGDVLGFTVKG